VSFKILTGADEKLGMESRKKDEPTEARRLQEKGSLGKPHFHFPSLLTDTVSFSDLHCE
jgi:hypothetical protein